MVRTRKYLDARASIGRDLYMEGKISVDEMLRITLDADVGRDSGPRVYLPESEWQRNRLAVLRAMELNRRKGGL